jgi:hypothetical protein
MQIGYWNAVRSIRRLRQSFPFPFRRPVEYTLVNLFSLSPAHPAGEPRRDFGPKIIDETSSITWDSDQVNLS